MGLVILEGELLVVCHGLDCKGEARHGEEEGHGQQSLSTFCGSSRKAGGRVRREGGESTRKACSKDGDSRIVEHGQTRVVADGIH